ncbi:MAG: hydantoinase/oxoprolinase [Treponema sp.]|jgi:N-methylhydantoinase A/oxoprolinase/acetone carboxylase beta subunit|nr:hydantoinase/oxoprolinase [Treponema sp.]
MTERKFRIGIDVGGTHTKAVAIENSTHEIVGKSSVKTTHDHPDGVAAGVIAAFRNCLAENGIRPDEVVFVSHSTTQATNALLEGDVAAVGIMGISKGGLEGFLARRQTHLADIDLGTGRKIPVKNQFLVTKDLSDEKIIEALEILRQQGAQVIVASMAFGVDDSVMEERIKGVAEKMRLPTTVASDITKLYGLTRRTRTAAINASILPKMLNTALSTENSIRGIGIHVPLMIMRGDGGVMDIAEMKRRPVLTMLSGPAASVMGSLMYLRASNGIYFEVGGTSTNIGVIKNGRPAIDYSILGGHRTFINSLDVRVLGVAGGSMVRAGRNGVTDVGPRSAHIAGLEYAGYTPEDEITGAELEFFSPKPGDPDDYAAIRLAGGKRVAITNSCAANVLGLVKPEHFSYGRIESARKAMLPLAEYMGLSIEETAEQILEKSCGKIEPVIRDLEEKYQLEHDQMTLVGVGGGAAALMIYYARKAGFRYNIPENAEVISSIGVALAMVRDVVERIIPNPTQEDIRAIKREATDIAVASGAAAGTVEVHIEIDNQTSKVTAIATGSTEVRTTDLLKECTLEEALRLAAADLGVSVDEVELVDATPHFYIFTTPRKKEYPIRILDKKGFIRVQRGDGIVRRVRAGDYRPVIEEFWKSQSVLFTDNMIRPDYFICLGSRIPDFSGNTNLEKTLMLMEIELALMDREEEIIVTAAKNRL